MSEELFVSQSAPTLAGIKTGNLFTAEFVNHEIAMDEIRQLIFKKDVISGPPP